MKGFIIREMKAEDIADVVALQVACFPPPFPQDLLWTVQHLKRHLEVFPAGQYVAESPTDWQIVASSSSLRISEQNWNARQSWDATLGGYEFTNGDPKGNTLYGADISVHPDWRRIGVGRAMYEARFSVVRRLSLTRYGTACRIPDFRAWQGEYPGKSPKEYVHAVAHREWRDRTLSPLLRYGLKVIGVLDEYMDDPESGNAAALLEWRP